MSKKPKPPRNPFEGIEPADGWEVNRVVTAEAVEDAPPAAIALYVQLRQQGQVVSDFDSGPVSVLIARVEEPDAADCGALDRLEHAARALCRYVNTGGDLEALKTVIGQLASHGVGAIQFPPYALVESVETSAHTFEHLFLADDGESAALWAEGQFVEISTLDRIRQMQAESQDDDEPDAEPDAELQFEPESESELDSDEDDDEGDE